MKNQTCLCGMAGYTCEFCATVVCKDGLNTDDPVVECLNCAVGRGALIMGPGECLSLMERVA